MCIPRREQASRFLTPLRGGLTILLLHDTTAKVPLGRFLLGCASSLTGDVTVLDTDVFYSANIDLLTDMTRPITGELLLLPQDEFEVPALVPLLSSTKGMLIIDDLNSLYSLASDGRKLHQLTVLLKLLSQSAKSNLSWAVATAYRPEGPKRENPNQRSLMALSDLVVDTTMSDGSLWFKSRSKGRWPDDELKV